jgi:predicted nucleotidyltransferase
MYNNDDIMQYVNLVAEVIDPDKIILFGSYAYGKPTVKSDLDLLVIKNGKDLSIDDVVDIKYEIFKKKMHTDVTMLSDLFIQTEKQVRESAKNGGAFVDALQKGKVVYERRT